MLFFVFLIFLSSSAAEAIEFERLDFDGPIKESLIYNGFDLNNYHSYNEIMKFLTSINKGRVSVDVLGLSSERRMIPIVKIRAKGTANQSIVVDGGIHAREWIAVSSALNLIANLSRSDDWPNNHTDVFVIPLVNPDGYEYSRQHNRMWRNNRSGRKHCGVDLNRNFPFHWGEKGSSPTVCSNIYRGSRPLSEPESFALARFLHRNRNSLKGYVSLHSYENAVLVPYGFKKGIRPLDFPSLLKMGKKLAESMNTVYGNNYTVMNSADLYPAGGCSDDFAKSLGIPFVYTIELTTGWHRHSFVGFETPTEMIAPTGTEVRAAVVRLLSEIR